MNIYERKGVDFKKLLKAGEDGEQSIIDAFEKTAFLRAKKVDHKLGYDLKVVDTRTGKTKNVEVKTHKGVNVRTGTPYNTFFAELIQNTDIGSVPEYLTTDIIDFVIHINQYENTFYVFDQKVYQKYAQANMYRMKEAKYATSAGITIQWNDPEAGFLFSIEL